MTRQRHLSKAPIREALIDIRFDSQATADDVKNAALALQWSGGSLDDFWEARIEIRPAAQQPSRTHTGTRVGTRLTSPDKSQVMQLRADGFIFSQLAPYSTWEAMYEVAFPKWLEYSRHVKAGSVRWIAVRFINALKLQGPEVAMETYFTAPPHVPSTLPQRIGEYLSRVKFPMDGDVATVVQASERPALSAPPNFILDIEVSTMNGRPIAMEEVAGVLTRLRTKKNTIFFEYITEAAAETFE